MGDISLGPGVTDWKQWETQMLRDWMYLGRDG